MITSRYFTKAITLIFVLIIHGVANANTLPEPPVGFFWYTSTNGVGSFLRPNGWHVHEEIKKNTNALFISREQIKENSNFSVGFSINQINNFSSASSVTPTAYAKHFIAKLIEGHTTLKAGVVKGGPADMNIARIILEKNEIKTIVHYITIGMDEEDKFYLIFFEAPESEWDSIYPIAAPMLNFLALGS